MKIISYIQKIFAVLFLSLLAASCTDEMIDRGGSTTPIEEGKLVDVKFTLDGAQQQTVVTRSGDEYKDPAQPKINDLLFLQYKKDGSNYELVHTWYTAGGVQGFSNSNTVNVQLLSGSDYIVYVLSNLEKYEEHYEEIVGENTFQGLSEGGSLSATSAVYTSFATPDDVKKIKFEPPLTQGPFGEEVMMAVATTTDKDDTYSERKFKSTLMPT